MTQTFPTHLFRFVTHRYFLTGRAITGGPSLSGVTQSVNTTGGGLWVFELGSARLKSAEQVKAWRAVEALIDDGVGQMIVPICDRRQSPAPVGGLSGGVPHSDGAPFSDESLYVGAGINGTVADAVALRATSMRLQMIGAGPLMGGEHFSFTHPVAGRRMYRVRTVEADLGAGLYDITFRPPLREAVAAGDEADFRDPSCLMKVASAHEMAPTMRNLRFASGADVRFIEAFE